MNALKLESKLKAGTDRIEVWKEISNAWRQITREAEKNLSGLGLCTTEFKILKILDNDGPTPMARLSDATMLSQPAITSFVDKLEAQGFVKRDRDNEDRRVIRIEITKKGQLLFRRGLKIHTKFVRELLSGIDDEELTQFTQTIKKLSSVEVRVVK